jgi:hypothetical protein
MVIPTDFANADRMDVAISEANANFLSIFTGTANFVFDNSGTDVAREKVVFLIPDSAGFTREKVVKITASAALASWGGAAQEAAVDEVQSSRSSLATWMDYRPRSA